MHRLKTKAKYVAIYAMFIALAMIFSYVESLIPLNIAIPGIKLGLANLVVIVALYTLDAKSAFSISIVRVILVAFTFSNLSAIMFSLIGAVCSILCMLAVRALKIFSTTGVSIAGAITHNLAQLIVAIWVVDTIEVLYYMPALTIAAVVSGLLIGLLASLVIQRIEKMFR